METPIHEGYSMYTSILLFMFDKKILITIP